jgi:phage tail-like protein
MLLDTKTMIPQVYSKERDIQVFNKLLDIILTSCKYDIDNLGNLYDAMKCPVDLLPLLASTLNYQYNFSDTVTGNRRTIDAFSTLEKYRGSEVGLKMAAALSLTSLDISEDNAELVESGNSYMDALRNLIIRYDFDSGLITIDYPNTYTLVRYLMDYVRPVGMRLELRSVTDRNINTDAMLIYADVDAFVRDYIPEIDSHVSRSFVNLSGIADDKWLDELSNNNSDTLDLNGG